MARDYSGFLFNALSGIGDTITKRREEDAAQQGLMSLNDYLYSSKASATPQAQSMAPQMQSGKPMDIMPGADKNPNAKKAYDYFLASGYAPHQAAGIVGNLMAESGLNTSAVNKGDGADGSNSIGIAQWNGPRAIAFNNFTKQNGLDPNSIDAQLAFVNHELNTTEKSAKQKLMASKNAQEATSAFIGYERPAGYTPNNPQGGMHYDKRLAYAQQLAGNGGGNVQVASNDPNFVPQMAQAAPQTQQGYAPSQNGLPPREVMRQLLANPTTRPLAIELAKNAMSGKDNAMKWGEIGKDENGAVTYGFINERTGQVTPYQSPGGSGAPRPPRAKFSDVTSARKDFENQPGVSRFREAAPIVASMAQSVDNNTAMADMDFIYGLAKILDPNSVVREGELQLTAGNQQLTDKIKGLYAKAASGEGQLLPTVRRDLLKVAMTRAAEYRKQAEKEVQQFNDLATEYGVDPRFVVRPLEQLPEMQQQQQQDPLGIR